MPVPIAGIVDTADGHGYWIVGQDGALYSYGDAGFLGSLEGVDLAAPDRGCRCPVGGACRSGPQVFILVALARGGGPIDPEGQNA